MRKVVLLILVSFSITVTLLAQVPMMNTQVIRTPYGNVKHTYYTGTTMHNYGYNGYSPQKLEYEVVFLNDSLVTTKAKLIVGDSAISYLKIKTKSGELRITPRQTKNLKCLEDVEPLTSVTTDSCWLFHVVKGRINAYSPYPTATFGFIAIQRGGGGPILPLTKENLLPMVATNERALKLAEKNKLQKAVDVYNGAPKESAD